MEFTQPYADAKIRLLELASRQYELALSAGEMGDTKLQSDHRILGKAMILAIKALSGVFDETSGQNSE